MFERFSTGFTLARQSWAVLKRDTHLLVFPFLSGVCCLLVLASFAIPLVSSGTLEGIGDTKAAQRDLMQNPIYLAVLFAFYFANYFVIVFFNSALIACAVKSFYGARPTIGEGIAASMARLPQIAGWALVSATVGLVLKAIESRSERVGQIVAGLLGMAWSAATFFVVPVLVIERLGPIAAVKRSTSILKNSWGEAFAGNASIGFFSFLLMLPAIGLIIGGVMLLANEMMLFGGVLIGLGICVMLVVSLVSSALSAIIQAAVYMYGSSGETPSGFDSGALQAAFARK
jgi:Family of unknown function (DUF6159)